MTSSMHQQQPRQSNVPYTLEDELQAIVVLSATLGTAQGNLFPMVGSLCELHCGKPEEVERVMKHGWIWPSGDTGVCSQTTSILLSDYYIYI
ncbi:hypothetical protein ZIOFF_009474 [Zingiber officinale]|uniref:Uncharacterized protein n=1 Tax=Zingiber officinale TaxID=94328 RepID=A0A8J5LNT0_ZINOF|nr:hypothetical protein ZIOFF_009474 [Zingiber officinale]